MYKSYNFVSSVSVCVTLIECLSVCHLVSGPKTLYAFISILEYALNVIRHFRFPAPLTQSARYSRQYTRRISCSDFMNGPQMTLKGLIREFLCCIMSSVMLFDCTWLTTFQKFVTSNDSNLIASYFEVRTCSHRYQLSGSPSLLMDSLRSDLGLSAVVLSNA